MNIPAQAQSGMAFLCLILCGCIELGGTLHRFDYDPVVHTNTLPILDAVRVEVVDGIVPKPVTTSLLKRYNVKVKVVESDSHHFASGQMLTISSYQSSRDYLFTNSSLLTLCFDVDGNLKGIVETSRKPSEGDH